MTFPAIRLKKNEDRRIRQGHVWVFSNEIDTKATPLTAFEPGQSVSIEDASGREIGSGYVNPHSLISVRLVSRDKRHPWTESLIVHRLNVALALRERLYTTPHYRLVFGESDGLPGLVVDRFDQVLVVQISTAGMEVMLEAIVDALQKLVKPEAIYLRNDSATREHEGLELYQRTALGAAPERLTIVEGKATFHVPLAGQKTGWYFDQADNRRDLARWVKGRRVLDVFSYVGGWGVQAALAGAESVMCVDQSATALDFAEQNAAANGVGLDSVEGDAFEALKALKEQEMQFDVVIVDPPAFIKRRKDFKTGSEAYRRINELAMRLLDREGILIACSCSHHLQRDQLQEQCWRGARHIDRNMQVLAYGSQAADHPIHPAIPETQYLKAIVARVWR